MKSSQMPGLEEATVYLTSTEPSTSHYGVSDLALSEESEIGHFMKTLEQKYHQFFIEKNKQKGKNIFPCGLVLSTFKAYLYRAWSIATALSPHSFSLHFVLLTSGLILFCFVFGCKSESREKILFI